MKLSGSQAFANQIMVFCLLTLFTGGGVGLGTVWMSHQIAVTANHNGKLMKGIADMERQLADVTSDIDAAQSPEALLRRNEAWHLNLVLPQEQTQVARIDQNPATLLAAKRNSRIFGEISGSLSLLARDKP